MEKAVTRALLELLANTDLVMDAVAAAQEERAGERQQRREELAVITGQIAAAEAAIDRYLDTFEIGALDQQTCGRRVRDLNVKIDQLKARREELQEDTGEVQLTAEDIEQARADLTEVLKDGENGETQSGVGAAGNDVPGSHIAS